MSEANDRHIPEIEPGYEKRDVNIKTTLVVAAAIVIFLIASLSFLYSEFILTKEQLVYDVALKPESVPLEELRARETETLTTYKLIDSTNQIYRIPIDSAMKLLIDKANLAPAKQAAIK